MVECKKYFLRHDATRGIHPFFGIYFISDVLCPFAALTFCSILRYVVIRQMVEQEDAGSVFRLGMLAHSAGGDT